MQNTSVLGTITLNNGRHGAYVAGSENILLDSNTFAADGAKESYEGCGVMITDRKELWSDSIIAKYNRIHNFYRAGFCIGYARWVGLIDSTITNNRRDKALCYDIVGAKNVTIIRGTCATLSNEADSEDEYATSDNIKSSAPATPEPSKCLMNEIEEGGVCCPGICGTCGGIGCHDRAPYKACCI